MQKALIHMYMYMYICMYMYMYMYVPRWLCWHVQLAVHVYMHACMHTMPVYGAVYGSNHLCPTDHRHTEHLTASQSGRHEGCVSLLHAGTLTVYTTTCTCMLAVMVHFEQPFLSSCEAV